MINMSEQKASFSGARERYPEDVVPIIDSDDLVDVQVFDLDDDERWLCEGSKPGSKSNIVDLSAWLRSEPENNEYTPPTRVDTKSIDSRTYTRAKRRSQRTSFDAMRGTGEGDLSLPHFPSRLDSEEMDFLISSTPVSQNFRLGRFPERNEEYVPAMLRPPSFSSPISTFRREEEIGDEGPESHESMEAFLNLTQSKGVDSFINMAAPEFTQDIMNVSQPSVLSSSSPFVSFSSKDNGNGGGGGGGGGSFGMADSQILTSSMMQTSMFDDTKDINSFLEPFESHDQNATVRPKSPLEETLTRDVDATFQIVSTQEVDNNPEEEEELLLHATWTQQPPADATFTSNEKPAEKKSLNNTYSKIDEEELGDTASSVLEHKDDNSELEQLDLQIEQQQQQQQEHTEVEEKHDSESEEQIFDMSKLKRSLLEESRRHSEGGKCDLTFDLNRRTENDAEEIHQSNNTFSIKNYNVWKKEAAAASVVAGEQEEEEENKLDSTFRKPTMVPAAAAAGAGRGLLPRRLPQSLSRLPQGLQKSNPNLISGSLNDDAAVTDKLSSRLRKPRGSQPNMAITTRAAAGGGGGGGGSGGGKRQLKALGDFGNNNLSRMRSGSEQRLLLQVGRRRRHHHVSDTRLSGGSTESIESTQSAHSAPDLDDRVSLCSDSSSRGSYTIPNNNIVHAHQLGTIASCFQQDSYRGDVTRIKLALNSTRTKENDGLRGPGITLKNGGIQRQQHHVDRVIKASLPSSSILHRRHNDYRVTTSSLGITNNLIRDEQRQPMRKIDDVSRGSSGKSGASGEMIKSKLRPPTSLLNSNNAAGSKASSGIPRPMMMMSSRIPGPKATRPKTAPAASKKDYF